MKAPHLRALRNEHVQNGGACRKALYSRKLSSVFQNRKHDDLQHQLPPQVHKPESLHLRRDESPNRVPGNIVAKKLAGISARTFSLQRVLQGPLFQTSASRNRSSELLQYSGHHVLQANPKKLVYVTM